MDYRADRDEIPQLVSRLRECRSREVADILLHLYLLTPGDRTENGCGPGARPRKDRAGPTLIESEDHLNASDDE